MERQSTVTSYKVSSLELEEMVRMYAKAKGIDIPPYSKVCIQEVMGYKETDRYCDGPQILQGLSITISEK